MPVVTRLDDSVEVNESFTIYGEGFDENSKVYALPITSSTITEFSSVEELSAVATECEVIVANSSTDALVASFDVTNGGSYNIYVTNDFGVSFARGLNTAEPQWVSDKETAEGAVFSIYGRNLSSYEFGGNTSSGVAFVNENGDAYNIPISAVNPYEIKCVLNSIPVGTYTVYVTNDGYIWNEVNDGRKVSVIESQYDPYNIGAALAKNYNFRNTLDISNAPYSATVGNDITYVLQSAINNISSVGGGVVYIPKGEYYISSVTLKKNVVLAGAGMEETILSFNGTNTQNMIVGDTDCSNTGIVNMKLNVPEDSVLPSVVIGLNRGYMPTSLRTVENIFIKNVSIKTKMTYDASVDGEGRGIAIGGKRNFLVDGCELEGFRATIANSYAGEYTKITNNKISSTVGTVSLIGEYCVMENNTITYHPELTDKTTNTQGIFIRGFSYVANNDIRNAGNPEGANDGELVCSEPYMGGLKLDGNILSATSDTVTVNVVTPEPDWEISSVYYGSAYLCITEGRGIGQYSKIKEFDEETNTITLENPFEILPDSSSKFVVSSLCENVTIYNNYCQNSKKGFWLYGDNVNSVIAHNTGVDTEGVYIRAITKNSANDYRQQIAYYIDVRDNNFNGGAMKSGVCGIGIGVNVESTAPDMTYVYGVNIRDNHITKDVPDDEYISGTESPHINGVYVIYNVRSAQSDIKTVIRQLVIEGNTISNSDRGITIGPNGYPNYNMTGYAIGDMTDNIFIGENQFNNVETTLIDERNYSYN